MSDIDYFSAIDSDSDVSFHSVASLHNASIASLSAVISGNPSRKLRSLIDCSNFVLLPLDPTHHNVSSHDTWIDHIITSSPDHVIDHGQLSASGFSRHDLLFISYKVKPPKVPAKLIRMRNLARINVEQLKLDARSIDWSPLLTAATVDDMISTLNSEVLKLFNHHAPVVDVRVKRPPAPIPKSARGVVWQHIPLSVKTSAGHRGGRHAGGREPAGAHSGAATQPAVRFPTRRSTPALVHAVAPYN
ncbi:hypothetical protein ACJJTC_018290 [Scirpophaga incertulas]